MTIMTIQQTILVDSNILVYAIDKNSPKNKIGQSFLQENSQFLVVAHQNICEALRVTTHPKFSPIPMKSQEAHKAILAITSNFRIIYPHSETIHLALQYIQEGKLTSNKIFDAYLAATALSN